MAFYNYPYLVALLPHGIPTAPAYDAAGGDFANDAQVNIIVNDSDSFESAWRMLAKFGERARAYYVGPMSGQAYQIELVMDGANDALRYYNNLPTKVPAPNSKPNVPAKFNGYVRILPDHIDWREGWTLEWTQRFDLAHAETLLQSVADLVTLPKGEAFVRKPLVWASGNRWNRLASECLGANVWGPAIILYP